MKSQKINLVLRKKLIDASAIVMTLDILDCINSNNIIKIESTIEFSYLKFYRA